MTKSIPVTDNRPVILQQIPTAQEAYRESFKSHVQRTIASTELSDIEQQMLREVFNKMQDAIQKGSMSIEYHCPVEDVSTYSFWQFFRNLGYRVIMNEYPKVILRWSNPS